MGKLHSIYRLAITTLTPLHIGTGNTLLRDYDYVTYSGRTWVLNTEALAELLYEKSPDSFQQMVGGRPASELLSRGDYLEDSPLFRYIMQGEPRSIQQGAVLQEQIKDGWSRPYIPGSSLKGALRTALAFVGWSQRQPQFNPNDLGNRAKFAAVPMEQKIFLPSNTRRGQEPNYDIMRAMQVGDSTPDERRQLLLLNVVVLAGEKQGSPIELEAVNRDVTFTADLALDGFLLKTGTMTQLGWQKDQRIWLRNLPTVVNAFTDDRLEQEQRRWHATQAAPGVRGFYNFLRQERGKCAENEFIFQLGWGGGWDSKTFAHILTEDERKFAAVIGKYKNQMLRRGHFEAGDLYPKSRRVIVDGRDTPSAPLGWVKIRMEEIA